MVRTQADDCVLQLTGCLQLFQQRLHRFIQLNIAGDISPCILRHIQSGHCLLIPGGHTVAGKVVIHMSGNGHVIHMEPVLIHILGNRTQHHLIVGSRPCIGVLHLENMTAPLCLGKISQLDGVEIIAQIRVRSVSVIVGQRVVVKRPGIHALLCKKLGQGICHVDIRTLAHTELPVRNQSAAVDIFPVAGTGRPDGHIVIRKYKRRIHHLVQSRGEIFPNGVSREAFRGQENQVIALKHPGVLIAVGGSQSVDIIRKPLFLLGSL